MANLLLECRSDFLEILLKGKGRESGGEKHNGKTKGGCSLPVWRHSGKGRSWADNCSNFEAGEATLGNSAVGLVFLEP